MASHMNKMKQLLSNKDILNISMSEPVARATAANTKGWLLGTIKRIMDQMLQ